MNYNNPNDFWQGYDPYKGVTPEQRMRIGCWQGVIYMVAVAIALAVCALLGSCTTTRYVPIIEYHTDTLRQVTVRHDSVMVRDSIHVSEKGDTIRIERWHTRWRDRWHTDTVYIAKTDSVPTPYPVEVTKEVPAPLTWWQQTRMHVGGIVIFLLIIFAVRKIYVTLHPRL